MFIKKIQKIFNICNFKKITEIKINLLVVILISITVSISTFTIWNARNKIHYFWSDFKNRIVWLVDMKSPEIFEVNVFDISQSSAKITWKTNELTTTKFYLGLDTNYLLLQELYTRLATEHWIYKLPNLESEKTYHFKIVAIDRRGNKTEYQDYIFSTLVDDDIQTATSSNISDEVKPEKNVVTSIKEKIIVSAQKDTTAPICSCVDNHYDCFDFFSNTDDAQKCFDYCVSQGKGDVHKLDLDNDGFACEPYINRPEEDTFNTDNAKEYVPNYIQIKYRNTPVDVGNKRFETLDTLGDTVVRIAYYDIENQYMIIKLNYTYYNYCGMPLSVWSSFKSTNTFESYYKDFIKGKYDCRLIPAPEY